MDHIVNRESAGMRSFSSESCNVANELEAVCSHLKQELYSSSDYMQDASAQEALSIVMELVETTMVAVGCIRTVAAQIQKSAELLEESDALL